MVQLTGTAFFCATKAREPPPNTYLRRSEMWNPKRSSMYSANACVK